jgi:hypothetical protein
MSFDAGRPYAFRRTLLSVTALLAALASAALASIGVASVGGPAPASAAVATGADLSATLTNRMAVAGERVAYVVVVTNHGPATAHRVQFDFFTSSALGSVRWSNPAGRCIRGPKETACLVGTLKPGQSARATVSGIVSKKLAKGTPINNRVVLDSDTHLINTANDTVTDNYRLGIPTVVPSPSPSLAPAETKIEKIGHAASDTIAATHTALLWSVLTLGAAAVWFAIGLTLKARKRRDDPASDFD